MVELSEQFHLDRENEPYIALDSLKYRAEVVHILYDKSDGEPMYGTGRALAIVEINGPKITIKATLFQKSNRKRILLLPSYTKNGKRNPTVEMDGDLEYLLLMDSNKQYEEMKKRLQG